MDAAFSGHGGTPGRSGTSSIHPPFARTSYVAGWLAFQRARVSVVIVAQPITALFRATHGATTAADATTTRRQTTTARRPGRTRQAAYGAMTRGRSTSRAFARIARP